MAMDSTEGLTSDGFGRLQPLVRTHGPGSGAWFGISEELLERAHAGWELFVSSIEDSSDG
ncbi:hypothetical protein ACIPY6_03815 [Streptomyces sp. NPDC090054]|uniref:hypothetical protein n=1 Tax=Streptomyces sp. NPDC090054 TaxID=3365933 RepID=UPI0038083749